MPVLSRTTRVAAASPVSDSTAGAQPAMKWSPFFLGTSEYSSTSTSGVVPAFAMSAGQAAAQTHDLIVTRVFDAPVDKVWSAWSTAESITQWWGPLGFTVPVAEMDFREGGRSIVCMQPEGGPPMCNSWTYSEIVPNERIVAQVHFFAEKPVWRFNFEPAEGGTQLTAQGEWTMKVPVVGKPVETMMVKEHAPFLEELLASFKTQVEAKTAA